MNMDIKKIPTFISNMNLSNMWNRYCMILFYLEKYKVQSLPIHSFTEN